MVKLTKKRILISAEQQNAQVGSFFREMDFELCLEFDSSKSDEYEFIVDDYLPELKSIPRLQVKKDILESCIPYVRAQFDESFLSDLSVRNLLVSYLREAKEFNLVDLYSKDFKNIYTLKVHDYLNIGYFIDTIIVEAYKNQFDFEKIRVYLNSALPYLLKLTGNNNYPLNVSFSHSDVGFALQISATIPETDLKFSMIDKTSALNEVAANCNFYDVTLNKKRDQLSIASSWFKEEKLKSFKASFYNEIVSRVTIENGSSLINILDVEQNVSFEIKPKEIEPEPVTVIKTGRIVDSLVKILGNKKLEDLPAFFSQHSGTEDDENITVKNWSEDDSDENWEVRRSQLLEKINEEMILIKSSGENVTEDDLVRIISSELNTNIEDSQMLVKSLHNELPENETMSVVQNIDLAKEKREAQITKMKVMMERMKVEMLKLRTELEETKLSKEPNVNTGPDTTFEVQDLKKALSKAIEVLHNKEKTTLKLRSDFEHIFAAKDTKIQELESKLLDVHNNNVEKEVDLFSHKEKEISAIKTNLFAAQALNDKFKLERIELENKLKVELEKELNYPAMMAEKKLLEEKSRAQYLELKKVEHKLKFVMAQLEESQRKKVGQPAVQAAKTNDANMKLLESTNIRLADTTIDLTEKKKELVKLKQENGILAVKVSELERKLANIEKKAA